MEGERLLAAWCLRFRHKPRMECSPRFPQYVVSYLNQWAMLRISQMRKERVQTGPRLSVAQFVVDAAILLLDRPHELHVHAAERLPAAGKPVARRHVVASIQQHQCQKRESRTTQNFPHQRHFTTCWAAAPWPNCRSPAGRPGFANAAPMAAE